MMLFPALKSRLSGDRRRCQLVLVALLLVALCPAQSAQAATRSGLVVIPRPNSQLRLSYFKLGARPGHHVRAGTIELRNLGASALHVALVAVNGQTLSTLGSGYASPGSPAQGSTRWLRVGDRSVILAPHHGVVVPVSVDVPGNAEPGDYLSGVSIEALNQNATTTHSKGIAVASVDRYVIGTEVSIAGPRHPLVRITGTEVQRQPGGVVFILKARNQGNAILPGTHGRALITEGKRTVAEVPLGPGTFVTDSAIAYPIAVGHEHPREGTVYRIRAYLRYPGGVTTLDAPARFGHAAALTQQLYRPHEAGAPTRPSPASRPSAVLLALAGALIAALALGLALLLLRSKSKRKRTRSRPALAVLEAALVGARETGRPLSLITVVAPAGTVLSDELVAALRLRLRAGDELCWLPGGGMLVVAGDTDLESAQALAGDLRRQTERMYGAACGLSIVAMCPDGQSSAPQLLQWIGQPLSTPAHVLTPSG